MAQLIATAACVLARNTEGLDVYLYRGAPVPENIPAAEVKRLKALGVLGTAPKRAGLAADDETSGGASTRPNKSAKAGDWEAYAVAQGVDPQLAKDATKEQLVAHFYDGVALPGETPPPPPDDSDAPPAGGGGQGDDGAGDE